MSFWQVIIRSLGHHRRINFAVALGVAAATAVLTGALIVGASMRNSLRAITLERLGRVSLSMVTPRFISEDLVEQTRQSKVFQETFDRATGLIYFPSATLETTGEGASRRAGAVQILGVDSSVLPFDVREVLGGAAPGEGEIVINQALAEDLGITQLGSDEEPVRLTLRLPKPQAVPQDSPLGDRSDLVLNLPRLKLVKIIPDEGLGRFGLQPTQLTPRNAFVSLPQVQTALEQEGRVNTIWVGADTVEVAGPTTAARHLTDALEPSFDDYGLLLKRVRQEGPDGTVVYDDYSLASTELLIDDALAQQLARALEGLEFQRVLTYLANDLDRVRDGQPPPGDQGVPYSMVSALSFGEMFDPVSAITGEPIASLADDEIVLNEWLADAEHLDAQPGDVVRLTYFEPETTHGSAVESFHDFRVKDIAKLVKPQRGPTRSRPAVFDQQPTQANDPDLTPEVPGVTDQRSIYNWNLPLLDDTRIDGDDDDYWQLYRTTPKAFITLAAGQSLWKSRFGQLTSFRIPADQIDEAELRQRIETHLANSEQHFGLVFADVKREGLAASAGTTPFDGLFLGLSLFIIISALMLVVLLFRLGLEQRASEAGLLLALGFSNRRVAKLFAWEGLCVAMLGGLLGVAIGIGYAGLMIWGLKTIWVGAIRTPFIDLYLTPDALGLGYLISLVVCGLTILWTVRRFRPGAVRNLLAGRVQESLGVAGRPRRRWLIVGALGVLGAIGVTVGAASVSLSAESQAGAFMGGGCLLLAGLLAWVTYGFQVLAVQHQGQLGLASLAIRNAARNRTRTTLTIGLVAVASFLIGAMSAFQMEPSESGTGGFDLMASTSRPIFVDLNSASDRAEYIESGQDVLAPMEVLSFRVRGGGDASCNNPYQVAQPRILAVSSDVRDWFAEHPDSFAFAGVDSQDPEIQTHPWNVLAKPQPSTTSEGRPVIPVILDQNTAMWSLKVYQLGQRFDLEYDGIGTLTFEAVGFLANTTLQGSLLISEADFKRLFPDISGSQFFLIDTHAESRQAQEQIRGLLEDGLSEVGLTTQRSDDVLGDLLAVQNTYLTTFQSLGALGLLLGTFGLATVQIRNVVERRGELGLMQALGFRRRRLGRLVLLENGVLLVGGLGIGTLAALAAVLPHVWVGEATIPWATLGGMLVAILLVGWLTGLLAVRATVRMSVQQALRQE